MRRAGGALVAALRGLGVIVFRLLASIEAALTRLVSTVVALSGRAVGFIGRYVTPERALVAVIGAAAICLAISQFVTYRGVQVGRPGYTGLTSVAPPPQTDRIDAGAAHAYLLIPLAVVAVAIAVIALTTGRWRLGRLVSLAGAIGIAISLLIDLPKGLDSGTAGVAFAGAEATLTEGFYVQVVASATLVVCGLLLGLHIRRAVGAERDPKPLRRPRARQAPSVAGGGA